VQRADHWRLRRGRQEHAAGLVVDAVLGAGRGEVRDGLVLRGDPRLPLGASADLHALVQVGGCPPHRDGVRVLRIDAVELPDHVEGESQPLRVNSHAFQTTDALGCWMRP
jgi:hypothetical protein